MDEGIDLYRHLIEVDPTNASGHFNLGLALAATGDEEGGAKEIEAGMKLNPALLPPDPLPESEPPEPTATPAPTATPEPTATPAATPEPTSKATPKPTKKPKPTPS